MRNLFVVAAAGMSIFLFSFKANAPAVWTVDIAHAKIGFSITHNMASDVEGSFRRFDATITTAGDDFAGAVFEFSADASSISTDNERRDKDIRSDDFLDVEKFPKVVFKSTSVSKMTVSTYKIAGDLTLHGITKPIVLDALVRIPPVATGVKNVAGFKVTGIIKRSDFGIGGAFANVMLGDEITLTANGEFAKR